MRPRKRRRRGAVAQLVRAPACHADFARFDKIIEASEINRNSRSKSVSTISQFPTPSARIQDNFDLWGYLLGYVTGLDLIGLANLGITIKSDVNQGATVLTSAYAIAMHQHESGSVRTTDPPSAMAARPLKGLKRTDPRRRIGPKLVL
jgi:hypothetical protein